MVAVVAVEMRDGIGAPCPKHRGVLRRDRDRENVSGERSCRAEQLAGVVRAVGFGHDDRQGLIGTGRGDGRTGVRVGRKHALQRTA